VRAPLRPRNNYALQSVLSIGVDTTLSVGRVCIASARTTLAVSAVAPSWSYFCCC